MKRYSLILSNPGEPGADNYCKGVHKDVLNYQQFFTSPIGGLWEPSEIHLLERPSVLRVRLKILELRDYDYVVVVFTGHGWYSTKSNSTILELRKGQEIDSAAFRIGTGKMTMILDCCREKHDAIPESVVFSERVASAKPIINPTDCRKYYDEQITKAPEELVVMYACAMNQRAGDDTQNGGAYTHNLIEGAEKWVETCDIDTRKDYKILTVPAAHDLALPGVQMLRGDRQTPQIEKPRSGPYYPFCVVA